MHLCACVYNIFGMHAYLCVGTHGLRVCVCGCEHVCGYSVLYASESVPAGIRKVDLGHKYLISVCCP